MTFNAPIIDEDPVPDYRSWGTQVMRALATYAPCMRSR
jgi:hypothetical protein